MKAPAYDALLLAATMEVDPAKASLDRHLNAALAAGARRVNVSLDGDVAERLLPILKKLVRQKIPMGD